MAKPQFKFTKDDLFKKVLQAYGAIPGGKVATTPGARPNLLQMMQAQSKLANVRKGK